MELKNIIIGDNINIIGCEKQLIKNRVNVEILNEKKCITLLYEWGKCHPEIWNLDYGVKDQNNI